MHKLLHYINEEMKDLETKVMDGAKLSMGEIQYGDVLAHFKKNLLTAEAMEKNTPEYHETKEVSHNDEIREALAKLMEVYRS